MGDCRVARRAGTELARMAAPESTRMTAARVDGSPGVTPKSIDCRTRVAASEASSAPTDQRPEPSARPPHHWSASARLVVLSTAPIAWTIRSHWARSLRSRARPAAVSE